jgi:hypothetical protein
MIFVQIKYCMENIIPELKILVKVSFWFPIAISFNFHIHFQYQLQINT